jgi:hypothetical protein
MAYLLDPVLSSPPPCRSALAAWLLGHRRGAIAHGMRVVDAAVRELLLPSIEEAGPLPTKQRPLQRPPVLRLDVRFVRPVPLPTRLEARAVMLKKGDGGGGSGDMTEDEEVGCAFCVGPSGRHAIMGRLTRSNVPTVD